MPLKKVSELSYHSFMTHDPGHKTEMRNACYDFWKRSWAQTFAELGVSKILHSDEFLNRTLSGLFFGTKPVGFMLHRFADLRYCIEKETEYFHRYPEHLRKHHFSQPEQVMIISFMTLDLEWRKAKTDLPISEILMGLSVCHFIDSGSRRLIGYFRNNRRTNEMFYRHGGNPIASTKAYNVDVDYGEIVKTNARLSTDKLSAEATLNFWKQHRKGDFNNGYDDHNQTSNDPTQTDLRRLSLG